MKLLLAHNFYDSRTPSGENQVFEDERCLLADRGHDVTTFTRTSDEIRSQGIWGLARGAFSTPWNPFAARELKRIVSTTNPDVIHVHNSFPLISPSIFHAVGRRAARVLTLHNYRLLCPAGIPLRAGKVCTECIDRRSVTPALRHGCYRGSRLATLPLAINVAMHRWLGTWRNEVDAFIVLSDFQKQIMTTAGLPERKIYVKPNFHSGSPSVVSWGERENYAVFVGRLSAEKGVKTLVNAWRQWGSMAPELRLVGNGPLREELKINAVGLPIAFLGQLSSAQARAQIARAKLLIVPSEWFEGFPMVIQEAFAVGTPVVVSNLGPLPSIVGNGNCGRIFAAGNSQSMFGVVNDAWNGAGNLEALGKRARKEYEAHYTADANYELLLNIYRQARMDQQTIQKEGCVR